MSEQPIHAVNEGLASSMDAALFQAARGIEGAPSITCRPGLLPPSPPSRSSLLPRRLLPLQVPADQRLVLGDILLHLRRQPLPAIGVHLLHLRLELAVGGDAVARVLVGHVERK